MGEALAAGVEGNVVCAAIFAAGPLRLNAGGFVERGAFLLLVN